MKKVTIWSLVAVLALLLYIVCTILFTLIFQEVSNRQAATNTPAPTFTITPIVTVVLVVLVTPATATASPISTSVPTPSATATFEPTSPPLIDPTFTSTFTPIPPQVIASSTVNIRSGPGTHYPIIGTLTVGTSLLISGRNTDTSWWQVQQNAGSRGWVAASVVEAVAVTEIAVAQASPPPEPTATPTSPPPTRPKHQFEPTGWYDDTNYGLTRFLGNITDINGNPVNGVTVEARCGTYTIISNPSGPVGGFDSNDSADDPPGFYDITVDKRPIPCKWLLTVIYTEDGKNVLAILSESVEIEVTADKSIITANWRKNW